MRALCPCSISNFLARLGVLSVQVVGSGRQVSEIPAPAGSSMSGVLRVRDIERRVRWLYMAKQSESAVDLAADQEKLKAAHATLVKEFEKLHGAKFNAVEHKEYLEKLKAHLLALEAHTAAIHKQHEALHA